MFIVQVNDHEGILQELVWIGLDRTAADSRFLSVCAERISNWGEYTAFDVQAILENGYGKFGGGVVMLIDASNCIPDDELRDQLTKQPAGNVTVAETIYNGELDLKEGMTVDQVLELCGRNLDSACSWEIQGQILFRGSDRKWYTITTESIVGEATEQFVKDTLAEIGIDGD